MPDLTPNLNLEKPLDNETADISVINNNMDKIDTGFGNIQQQINNIDVTGTQITVDQSQAPASPGNGTLAQLFSWLANRIKAITGKSNWWEAPDTTLANAKSHIDAAAPHSGHETPAGAQAKVDAHVNATDPHPQYALDSDLSSHTVNTTTAHGINTKVSKSGDTMTGPLMFSNALPSGVNTADTPDKWPSAGITQYVVTPKTLQNQPNSYGIIFHQGITNTKYQLFFLWSHPNGGVAGNIWYRHAGEGDTSWSQWCKIWHAGNDGAGSGLDADTLQGKAPSDFQVSATSRISGSITYTDTIPANSSITKTIVLGGNYKQGRAIFNNELVVEFTTNNLKSFMYGSIRMPIDSSTYYQYPKFYTREQLGSITVKNSGNSSGYAYGGFGANALGSSDTRMLQIQECYINGTNLEIAFKNVASDAYSINCTVYWEVW